MTVGVAIRSRRGASEKETKKNFELEPKITAELERIHGSVYVGDTVKYWIGKDYKAFEVIKRDIFIEDDLTPKLVIHLREE